MSMFPSVKKRIVTSGEPQKFRAIDASAGASEGKAHESSTATADESYGPQSFYKAAVGYKLRGQIELSGPQQMALNHILGTHEIPDDFEANKAAYGPLAGTSWEERVLQCYYDGTLPLKAGVKSRGEWICSSCGKGGHKPRNCHASLGTMAGWSGGMPLAETDGMYQEESSLKDSSGGAAVGSSGSGGL